MMKRTPKQTEPRLLLVTMTREPFQPVRVYYSIPNRTFVTDKLRTLQCMAEVRSEGCWQWLFHAEAAPLPIGAGYAAVPPERQPIVLGRIRFPEIGGMMLQTNSIERAIAAARFFAPRLGSEVVAMRVRVVNRCFAADEGHPDELMKRLDQDVSVIDPREAEAAFSRDFKGVRTMAEFERAAKASMKRRLASMKDVPLVEDYPLAPEEETQEFRDLATGLGFRFVRAMEHWKGNTHLTLTAIVVRTVEEGMRRGGRPSGR